MAERFLTGAGKGPGSAWPWRWLRRLGLYPLLAALSARKVRIANSSMYPLLAPGDELLFDRLAYQGEAPRRGDIVLVEWMGLPEPRLVKLLAGLPGERIEVRQDRLWVDGRRLAFPQPIVGSLPGRWQLGPDEYFLFSHNVAVGSDSRHFGPVPHQALRARAWLLLSPASRRRALRGIPLEVEPAPAGPSGGAGPPASGPPGRTATDPGTSSTRV